MTIHEKPLLGMSPRHEWLKITKCKFGYHKYFLIKKLTPHSRKIGCSNCGKYFAMNDDVQSILKWDIQFEELYKMMGIL